MAVSSVSLLEEKSIKKSIRKAHFNVRSGVRKTGRLFQELQINRKLLEFEENFIIVTELRKFQL